MCYTQDLKRIFNYFNASRSGFIDRGELMRTLQRLGENPTVERVEALLADVDEDGGGSIDYEEFRKAVSETRHEHNEGDVPWY